MTHVKTKPRIATAKKYDWLTLLAFFSIVVLGGSNAVAVRFSNFALPPFWGAALRFGSAAALFWVIVLIRRVEIPRGRTLIGVMIYGALNVGISYALLYWALVTIQASQTMVIGAMTPLFTFFFAWAHGQEAFRWRGLAGGLVAFGGILFGVSNDLGTSLPILPMLAVVLGFAAVAEGAVLIKSYPRSDPLAVNAIALSVGTLILLLVSMVAGEVWRLPNTQEAWISYGYLVLGGSVALFYLFLFVLDRWSASATSYSFLLFPVATIVIAAWLANETITRRFLVGTVIVLAGVWLGAITDPTGSKSTQGGPN
jgi:drug/metabolite transporter (DMT)-like permease